MTDHVCESCPLKRKVLCCTTDIVTTTTDVVVKHCKFRDPETLQCTIYKRRFFLHPGCHSVERGMIAGTLPAGCTYYSANTELGSTIQDEERMRAKFGEKLWVLSER